MPVQDRDHLPFHQGIERIGHAGLLRTTVVDEEG
jgi:hypothetical protein